MTDEADRLYELPLDDFTRERNALATRKRKAGDRAAAEEVKALAKPSVPAWAINQLARRRRKEMEALLDAGERLRAAQQQALAGKADADAVRKAEDERRDAVDRLTDAARDVLADAGRPATDATVERVAATLAAAAVADEARPLLAAGRLTGDVQPQGFEALAGMAFAPPPKRAPKKPDRTAQRKREAEARRELARLSAEAEALERAAAKARKAADEAHARVREAEERLAAED